LAVTVLLLFYRLVTRKLAAGRSAWLAKGLNFAWTVKFEFENGGLKVNFKKNVELIIPER
jgi:hypothetical protein